jgi:hypothetical protein
VGVDESSHTCAAEFRHLGHRRLETHKVGITSSKGAKSRACDKVVLAFRCFGYRKAEIRALGVVSVEDTIGRRHDRAENSDREKSAS